MSRRAQPMIVASVSCVAIAVALLGTSLGAQSPRITEQQSPTTKLIQAVHAVNARVLWASGHGGVVLRSVDGGAHWELRPTPAGDSIEFRDVHALDADTAWIMSAGSGRASRIYRTADGGAHWTLQHQNTDSAAFFDCLTFLDRRIGIVYSDAANGRTMVLRTADAGATWSLLPPSAVPAPLTGEGAFAASGLCVVASDPTHAFIATGAPGARLFRSADAGRTWRADSTPFVHSATGGLTGLAIKNGSHGIMVAADIARLRNDTSSAVVGVTTDAGRTWTMRSRPPLPGALSGVAWVPDAGPEVAVAVGFGGSFVTNDGGRTWQTINNAVFTGVAAVGRTAWIAGANGKIVRLDWEQ